MIGIKWPHKITNKKLYKATETEPLSITITERRWKLLGYILRLPVDCPAKKAMRYYSEERANKKFVGRRKIVIITTINKGIRRTKELEEKRKAYRFPNYTTKISCKAPKDPHKSEELVKKLFVK